MADQICLVVDDEPAIRCYVRAIIETQSLQVLEADNAPQALRIVQKLGGRLHLIVSDIKMPGEMDGFDLAYSIRHSFPDVPLVLISGYDDDDCVKRCAAFEFIQKPFTPEAVLKATRRAMIPPWVNERPTAVNE
jgi:two-component system cell cycle sensor histidine kinase/response regulator CckA